MRANEFLIEYAISTWKEGSITVKVESHVKDQASTRLIPWKDVIRIFKRIGYVKPKLYQMANFEKFYLRDSRTEVELGCRFRFTSHDNDREALLTIMTVVSRAEVRHSETPTILVN